MTDEAWSLTLHALIGAGLFAVMYALARARWRPRRERQDDLPLD
jgi:hypothetical protein